MSLLSVSDMVSSRIGSKMRGADSWPSRIRLTTPDMPATPMQTRSQRSSPSESTSCFATRPSAGAAGSASSNRMSTPSTLPPERSKRLSQYSGQVINRIRNIGRNHTLALQPCTADLDPLNKTPGGLEKLLNLPTLRQLQLQPGSYLVYDTEVVVIAGQPHGDYDEIIGIKMLDNVAGSCCGGCIKQ